MRPIPATVFIVCIAFNAAWTQHHPATGSRVAALSGASAALPEETWALGTNPASLAGNTRLVAAAFAIPALYGLTELRTVAASASLPLAEGAVGACVSRFGFALYNEMILSVGCGVEALPGVAIGGALHGCSIAIERYGRRLSCTADVGLIATIVDEIWIGFAVRPVWGNMPLLPGSALPRALSTAIAASPREGALIIIEMEKQGAFPLMAKIGIELLILEPLVLRAGAATNPETFSAGCSLRLGPVACDYGGFVHQDLGWTHTFELRFQGGH